MRLLSNLPYSISTPIILRLVETGTVSDAHLMLQREFALRMTARPGRKEYGSLTVLADSGAEAEILFQVPPTVFPAPPPGRLGLRAPRAQAERRPGGRQLAGPPGIAQGRLLRPARLAKALAHGLDLAPEVVAAWCAAAQVDPGLRADAVTPPQYRRLVACRPGRAGGQDILTG